ncbi:conserved hypothetical protein [Ricinus communis]|uniref:Cytochrome P450 n=1 Tax=Ricinus communis TaxID=3988 RepID=B9RMU4_RICCO|nr:conserved hypothetical protein [Ricinus communis]
MGMVMMEIALANLLYCFNWKLPSDTKGEFNMEEKAGLTVAKKIALRLVPINYLCWEPKDDLS